MKKKVIIVIGCLVLLAALVQGGIYLHAKQWDLKHGFPWEDVEPCLKNEIETLSSRCPICGCAKKKIYFNSPSWTWQQLCGRSGVLTICEHCKIQYEFEQYSMN